MYRVAYGLIVDRVPRSLVWKYIQIFTGDTKIQDILHDMGVVENGILLEHNVHDAFRNLNWELKPRRRMAIASTALKHSDGASTSTAQESERAQSCVFLMILATSPRIRISVRSTLPPALSLLPVVQQKFSADSSNTIRTSSVLPLRNICYQQTPIRMTCDSLLRKTLASGGEHSCPTL